MSELGPWEPFDVETVRALMAGSDVRWWLSGGCALDLFVGKQIRRHGDIDVSIAQADWVALHLHVEDRLECFAAQDGVLSPAGLGLDGEDAHNIWTREPGGPWRLQINLEPVANGEWRYRRDERVRRRFADVVLRDRVVPYVNPAVQLLWKAKQPLAKDELDFTAVFDLLSSEEQRWLAESIAVAHPESPWTARLSP